MVITKAEGRFKCFFLTGHVRTAVSLKNEFTDGFAIIKGGEITGTEITNFQERFISATQCISARWSFWTFRRRDSIAVTRFRFRVMAKASPIFLVCVDFLTTERMSSGF